MYDKINFIKLVFKINVKILNLSYKKLKLAFYKVLHYEKGYYMPCA